MLLYEAQSLCKYYRGGPRGEVRAVDDVSLTIERGSLTVVAGASGSGKTTLLALLGALERPTRGRVLFEGDDLTRGSDMHLARLRRRMGFVFQDFSLIPNLSAEDNVTYPLIPRGVPRGERRRRAGELLSRLGMADRLAAPARQLSGGEQQRVAVARALAGRPDVLLADEPTASLDADLARGLLDILEEMRNDGRTVIVASHDPGLRTRASRVWRLRGGRLTAPDGGPTPSAAPD